ncbi:MAG: glycosyltransferase family 2 protein [Ferruginibacter sp.]
MDVSIILVNYKSAQLVLNCIESIYQQTAAHSFEIILVDNDSKDNCAELVLTKYPEVRFIGLRYNAGFARANNAGIEISKGQYILILNTDTIILDGAIDKSVMLLCNRPDAVGCGVQLLNVDYTTQISGAHIIKGGLNTLLPLPYLGRLIRWLGYQFKSTVPSVQTISNVIEVDWIVGAYILVKSAVLKKSGLMDNDFFMYAEEIEWCGRLRKHGKLLLFGEARVIHIGGGTSSGYYSTSEIENGKNLWDKKGRQIIVSTMLRIRKQFGIFWFLFISGVYVFEIVVFFIFLFFDNIFNMGKSTYKWTNFLGYSNNIGVLLSYFFRMARNKPFFYKVQ